MPIKFRCEYCRQLMGIAQSKAGTLVDCPTCGRTLRVPNKDGTKDPPPKPRVNLADDGLRKALDELAQLGSESTGRDDVPLSDRPTPSAPRRLIPGGSDAGGSGSKAMAPAIVELPVNPQLDVVALEPLPPMKMVDPPAPARSSEAGAAAPAAGVSPEQILAAIPSRPAPSPLVATTAPVGNSPRTITLPWVIVAMSVSLAIGIGAGFMIGRYSVPASLPAAVAPDPEQSAAKDPEPTASLGQINGNLTYYNAQSQLVPDAGACVLVLPAEPESWSKLSATGFRPNDDEVSRQTAMMAIAEQGGRLVQSDQDGYYEIAIPEGGEYNIVYLSHYQGRAADDPTTEESLKILATYFDRPSRLIGQLAVHTAQVKHSGETSLTMDQTFGK